MPRMKPLINLIVDEATLYVNAGIFDLRDFIPLYITKARDIAIMNFGVISHFSINQVLHGAKKS